MKKPYKIADYAQISSGFAVMLDGRQAATPMGNPLVLEQAALAEAIAREWQEQADRMPKTRASSQDLLPFEGRIKEGVPQAQALPLATPLPNPLPQGERGFQAPAQAMRQWRETMPLTQIACIALDLAEAKSAELATDILSYGETDLICYRAGDAPELRTQQAELLDPLLEWGEQAFGVVFLVTDGVMPVKQPHGNHAKLALALAGYDRWKLAALAASIKPLGSLMLALALVEGRIGGEEAFRLSHLEELHAAKKWGGDEENEKRLAALQEEIIAVERFLRLLMSSGNRH